MVKRLGRVEYLPTWQAMREFTRARSDFTPDELWLLEHPPVYTVGQGGKSDVPEAILGMPSNDVITNSRRWPSSRFHITGLLESTWPGKVRVLAGDSDARGTEVAATGDAVNGTDELSNAAAVHTTAKSRTELMFPTTRYFPQPNYGGVIGFVSCTCTRECRAMSSRRSDQCFVILDAVIHLRPSFSETVPTMVAGMACVHASPLSCDTLFLVT